jgi:hypothetical protein
MSKASASPATSHSTTPVKEPAKTSPLRLGILLGVLVIAIGLLAHHYLVGAPATEAAYISIDKLFSERNSKGVTNGDEGSTIDANLLKPKDIQEHLKKQPFSTTVKPEYTVENYWWYGLPHKNYIAVLYYGSGDNLRFHTHYLNSPPPAEDLPGAELKGGTTDEKSNQAPAAGADGNTGPAPTDAGPAPAADAPATEAPAADAPAEKSTEEKPAEEKPAAETPADK